MVYKKTTNNQLIYDFSLTSDALRDNYFITICMLCIEYEILLKLNVATMKVVIIKIFEKLS